jgi:hypothetical protein
MKRTVEEKIFIKKMVAKITFFGIGSHLIYKFYRITGMADRIFELFGGKIMEEVILVKDEENECELPVMEEGVLAFVKTKDCVLLKFKTPGKYVLNNVDVVYSKVEDSDYLIRVGDVEVTDMLDEEINGVKEINVVLV